MSNTTVLGHFNSSMLVSFFNFVMTSAISVSINLWISECVYVSFECPNMCSTPSDSIAGADPWSFGVFSTVYSALNKWFTTLSLWKWEWSWHRICAPTTIPGLMKMTAAHLICGENPQTSVPPSLRSMTHLSSHSLCRKAEDKKARPLLLNWFLSVHWDQQKSGNRKFFLRVFIGKIHDDLG